MKLWKRKINLCKQKNDLNDLESSADRELPLYKGDVDPWILIVLFEITARSYKYGDNIVKSLEFSAQQ